MYRTPLPGCAARLLIAMWRKAGREWFHVPSFGEKGGDPLKAKHWGLIEPMPDMRREDGSTRTGWWRLTDDGVEFVNMAQKIPERAHLFNGRCYGYSGGMIDIKSRIGKGFNYAELMGWNRAGE
jgi:hypothetical protein